MSEAKRIALEIQHWRWAAERRGSRLTDEELANIALDAIHKTGEKRNTTHTRGATTALSTGEPPSPPPLPQRITVQTSRVTTEKVLLKLAIHLGDSDIADFYNAVADAVGWGF